MTTLVETVEQHESSKGHIAQLSLVGQLKTPSPMSQPPVKNCLDCGKRFKATHGTCFQCRKKAYAKALRKPVVYDSYLDVCGKCDSRTLHLGPGWCVDCHSDPHVKSAVYCDACALMFEIPAIVLDECGGEIDMLAIESLWCLQCSGPAYSWVTLYE
ncbi:hypothetical protein B0T10DRAFT_465513 [Thelonectria olida]|uniref:Uncharacterized protein n=1 Tax=Thelonectria olida TaxID=1576542 RepID=A0A9P8VTF4_9HYPO|nr:hypothetical protein B0T10DRAFT_465513 [Thelonectria olida]